MKQVFLLAIALLLLVQAGFWFALSAADLSAATVIGLLLAFFIAFNVLEPSLPSLVSRLAPAGARGVVVQSGYAEEDESQMIYLVRFEDVSGELGPPIGCLPEELTQQVPAA